MIEDIEKIEELKKELEKVKDRCNDKVTEIVETYFYLRRNKKFVQDSEQSYSFEGSQYAVLKTTHIPQSFDSFQCEGENVNASGNYYGSRGYISWETVEVPKRWFEYTEDRLEKAMLRRWAQVLSDRGKEKEKLEEIEKQKRLKQFEKLKQEFE